MQDVERVDTEKQKPRNDVEMQLQQPGRYRPGIAYGHMIYRFRWAIIVFWGIVIVASIPFAFRLSGVLTGSFTSGDSESGQVTQILTQKLKMPPSQALVVFHSEQMNVADPIYQQEINNFTRRVRSFAGVTNVVPSPPGKDERTLLVTVHFAFDLDRAVKQMPELQRILPQTGPVRASLTGTPAIYQSLIDLSHEGTKQAERLALPIVLIVLFFIFGTLPSAMMPLLLALSAVEIALAIIYGIALQKAINAFVLSVVSCLGLGLSIDYSLLLIRRFREELTQGCEVSDAVARTVATAGEAILFSGLVVLVGFLGLFLIGLALMDTFAIGGSVVVVIAVLAALSLLPAWLAVLGPNINRFGLPGMGRFSARPLLEQMAYAPGFWQRLAMAIQRRPFLVIVCASTLLLLLGWPVFQLQIVTPNADTLPAHAEARQGLELLKEQYPGLNENPILIVVQTPDRSKVLSSQNIAQVERLIGWLTMQSHVVEVVTFTRPPQPSAQRSPREFLKLYNQDIEQPSMLAPVANITAIADTTLIVVRTDTTTGSKEGEKLIQILRADAHKAAPGLIIRVGGIQAGSLDFHQSLYGNFPRAIVFIVVATYILLLFMFRSLVLPLKAVLMNLLSISTIYGALVLAFQWGYLGPLLGFTSIGAISDFVPILLFCLLFGLSMDYEVFLLARIREEWLRIRDNNKAVALGLEKTGSVITHAALLFVIVSSSFTLSSLLTTKEIGFGLTLAVLLDATIIRILLVPATMCLLGRWNWWPHPVRDICLKE